MPAFRIQDSLLFRNFGRDRGFRGIVLAGLAITLLAGASPVSAQSGPASAPDSAAVSPVTVPSAARPAPPPSGRPGKGIASAATKAGEAGEAGVRDPFSWPDLSERLALASQERIRRIVHEEMQTFRHSVTAGMRQEVTSMIDRARNEIMESAGGVPGQAPGEGGAGAAAQVQSVPEGARFIGCVDGRALYRDASGVPFYFDNPTAAGVMTCGSDD